MALEEKGMALGKRGLARRHAKRGWGKHYLVSLGNMIFPCSVTNIIPSTCRVRNENQNFEAVFVETGRHFLPD